MLCSSLMIPYISVYLLSVCGVLYGVLVYMCIGKAVIDNIMLLISWDSVDTSSVHC